MGEDPVRRAAPSGTIGVEVILSVDNEGAMLTLRHTAMLPTHAADHENGWAHLLGERFTAAVASAS